MSGPDGGARTVAELGRRFDEFLLEYREDRQEARELAKTNVTREVYRAERDALLAHVNAVESGLELKITASSLLVTETRATLSWVSRLLGGTIATGIIGVGLTFLVHR